MNCWQTAVLFTTFCIMLHRKVTNFTVTDSRHNCRFTMVTWFNFNFNSENEEAALHILPGRPAGWQPLFA
jgi:hypothetical protein